MRTRRGPWIRCLIDGRWQPAACGAWGERNDPSDGTPLGRHAASDRSDAEAAVAAARCAFEQPQWAHDAPAGRALLSRLGAPDRPVHLLMDRAYEGNETWQLALDLGFIPVVPPLKTRVEPWEYDREMYKRRNEVERLFRRLKGYRRIFSRFEKLDVMFVGFISFALIADGLRLR